MGSLLILQFQKETEEEEKKHQNEALELCIDHRYAICETVLLKWW